MCGLWRKIYFIKKTVFENFMKWGMKGGISIATDSGPLGYVLWCCGSRTQDFFTFTYSDWLWPYCVWLNADCRLQRVHWIYLGGPLVGSIWGSVGRDFCKNNTISFPCIFCFCFSKEAICKCLWKKISQIKYYLFNFLC